MAAPLRVGVLGAGAFGRNHVRIYRELAAAGHIELAAIADANSAALDSALEHATENAPETRAPNSTAQVRRFSSLAELTAALDSGTLKLDAASICLPTRFHAEAAIALLTRGVHVLVEKPIASTLDEAQQMIAAATAANRVLQVGHLERFNPAVTAAMERLNHPMFFEVHRLSIFTPRSLDVDVVLDLMIHDLDILLRMAASPVTEVRAVGLPVLSARTDIANVRLEFESGCVANLTASRVSTEQVRKLRFFQPHQYISLDYKRQEAFAINVTPAQDPANAANPELGFQSFEITKAEPLRLELESFLNAARNNTKPEVTATQATEALALALKIAEAIAHHTKTTGLA